MDAESQAPSEALQNTRRTWRRPIAGVFSPDNEQAARDAGIECVALPQRVRRVKNGKAYEASLGFEQRSAFGPGSKVASVA